MNTSSILSQIDAQISLLQQARALLSGNSSTPQAPASVAQEDRGNRRLWNRHRQNGPCLPKAAHESLRRQRLGGKGKEGGSKVTL